MEIKVFFASILGKRWYVTAGGANISFHTIYDPNVADASWQHKMALGDYTLRGIKSTGSGSNFSWITGKYR